MADAGWAQPPLSGEGAVGLDVLADPHPNPPACRGRELAAAAEPLTLLPPERGELEGGDSSTWRFTLREAFAVAVRVLRGVATPELDARLLLCHATGIGQEAFIASPEAPLAAEAKTRLDACLARRLAGEPVSRILGFREFYGRSFAIDPQVLDPRPDTETLIEAALALAEQQGWRQRPIELLDLGVGSGAILVTLLAELPKASGVGIDRSEAALGVARENAEALGVGKRASLVRADWLAPVGAEFDLIVSNPPYLSHAELGSLSPEVGYDPLPALDGGRDGLEAYRLIAKDLKRALRPGGIALLEIGANQAEPVAALLRQSGLSLPEGHFLWRDLAGRPRCIAAMGEA